VLSQSRGTVSLQELPESIAAIDLGTNSFHMVVAKMSHGEIRTRDTLGEKVQLGAGLNAAGELSEEAKERALDCLRRFSERLRELDSSSVQVVGTNALRVAKNRRSFLREAEQILGFPIEIISGREEARLIYLGVAHTLADDAGNRLVIDIGGGSTEFIIGERFKTKALESLHMGCVSFRERYFPTGELTVLAFNKAIRSASVELLNIQHQYASLGWDSCVGSSGSIKAVYQVLQTLGYVSDVITYSALEKLKQKMIQLGHVDHLREYGLKQDRVSIFPSGFAILYACFDVFKIDTMTLTSGALREGLLYDIIGRIRHEDVRERSIKSMQLRYDVDIGHAEDVEKTVIHAYQQVAKMWKIDNPHNELLLRWASRIFEVGLAISHSQYHKHGAYLVQYSDLSGFTRLSQLHLSTIVRAHRRKFSDEIFVDMKPKEKTLLKKLCAIFRLAVVMTAARKGAETAFTLSAKKQVLVLSIGSDYQTKYPLTYSNIENEQELVTKQGFVLKIE
jgi:exopolyphosphatase/guanosine-5'-triphosphate,3'-diphosphate pyrophosphatase